MGPACDSSSVLHLTFVIHNNYQKANRKFAYLGLLQVYRYRPVLNASSINYHQNALALARRIQPLLQFKSSIYRSKELEGAGESVAMRLTLEMSHAPAMVVTPPKKNVQAWLPETIFMSK